MANLPTKTFAQIVSDQATYIQSASVGLVDFAIGSVLRAIVEANSSAVLWLQGLLLNVLATTRAATSSGADLDSWCADYNFYRLPAAAASGAVTFRRFSTGIAAFIPVGTQIQTSDASPEVFSVTIDATNASYSAALNGYTLAAGIDSLSVPVLANVAGAAGNVLAGQCNVLTQSIVGVDTVTNTAAFASGMDAESDAALRARFVLYLGSLAKGTKLAIMNAVQALGQNVNCTITENLTYTGVAQAGYFYVVVDDGTGVANSALIASAGAAVDAARPFTVAFNVVGPTTLAANVALTLATDTGYTHAAVAAQVQAALASYINNLKLGQPLPYSRLAQIAYDASSGVTNVTAVSLNLGTSDLVATSQQVIKAGTITVY